VSNRRAGVFSAKTDERPFSKAATLTLSRIDVFAALCAENLSRRIVLFFRRDVDSA
jgi:hypothetical protein